MLLPFMVQRVEQQQEQRRQLPSHVNYLQNPENPPRPLLKRSVTGIAELAAKPHPGTGLQRSAPLPDPPAAQRVFSHAGSNAGSCWAAVVRSVLDAALHTACQHCGVQQ